ncbi:hypothetical protein [Streptomyces sp. x-80]|uniref:hypothetical protein n=1 Tax=Streptomyces sp. x-80 TaxID=2789282 RepID=UPI0039800CA7
MILGGPVVAPLDAQGQISATLPATDAPEMIPDGWSYTVTEALSGIPAGRSYQILLPAEAPAVDLADIAPTDPSKPNYVAVRGDSAYEVALAAGFEGTVADWLDSLIGPPGPRGEQGLRGEHGETGPPGADGAPGTDGLVQSVNGHSAAEVRLDAADVGAIPASAAGAAGGVAQLDATGHVPAAQLPAAGAPALPGSWMPDDYGLAAWAYDLGATSRTPATCPRRRAACTSSASPSEPRQQSPKRPFTSWATTSPTRPLRPPTSASTTRTSPASP